MKNINEFLNYIHRGNKSEIRVYKNNTMKSITVSDVDKENQCGDVYFVVNSGGSKNEEINMFNAVFIDLDCGKDSNNNYHSLEVVQKYKNSKLQEIDNFDLKPTFIVETRNGFHVYWVLKDNITLEEWKNCISRLIAKFKSDKQVNNPSRLMRLPYTYWMKDNKNPFYVNIVKFNDIKYDINDMIAKLESVEGFKGEQINKYYNTSYMCSAQSQSKNANYNTQAIKDGNIAYLQSVLNHKPTLFENQQEFYIYITQSINLYEFLGVCGESFKCIFHDDKSPSAGIFISNRNQYFYNCFSDKCGFKGNIIRCVERLRNCTRPQAINFIKQVYNLDIKDTDWQKEQRSILEENKRMIREGELEEYYPDVYKTIKRYEHLIYVLHDIASDNVYDEKYSDSNNNTVFFSSLKTIATSMNLKSHSKTTDRIALLAFLQLINKLPESEIPESYLSKSKEIAGKYGHKNIVNFYSIPSYCDSTLDKSNERAKMFLDNNITMKGWSMELLQRTFGKEIIEEVYPQFSKFEISDKSEDRSIDIHKVTCDIINEKGYAFEKDIVNELKSTYGKTKTEIQIKRILQEMLNLYDLQRVRANKELKEKYKVDSKGYPFIIIRNN